VRSGLLPLSLHRQNEVRHGFIEFCTRSELARFENADQNPLTILRILKLINSILVVLID